MDRVRQIFYIKYSKRASPTNKSLTKVMKEKIKKMQIIKKSWFQSAWDLSQRC